MITHVRNVSDTELHDSFLDQQFTSIRQSLFMITHVRNVSDTELHDSFLDQHFTSIRQSLFLHGGHVDVVSGVLSVLVVLARNS